MRSERERDTKRMIDLLVKLSRTEKCIRQAKGINKANPCICDLKCFSHVSAIASHLPALVAIGCRHMMHIILKSTLSARDRVEFFIDEIFISLINPMTKHSNIVKVYFSTTSLPKRSGAVKIFGTRIIEFKKLIVLAKVILVIRSWNSVQFKAVYSGLNFDKICYLTHSNDLKKPLQRSEEIIRLYSNHPILGNQYNCMEKRKTAKLRDQHKILCT